MTSLVDISPVHLKIVQDILRENLPPGVAVWVFGSRANWTTRDSSDLDLALEGDSAIDHGIMVALETAFEESNLPYTVDVVDLSQLGNRFRQIVETQKISLSIINEIRCDTDEWQNLQFGNCAELAHDLVSPIGLTDTPYIGLEHIGQNTLSLIDCGNASTVNSTKIRFQQGDILFGKLRPYFRKVVRVDFDGICSTDIWVVRPTKGVDADFLFYVMASPEFIDVATRGSEGTKMPRAKWEWVSRYKIYLPSLPEQRVISYTLRTLDNKIELNRRMNCTLEEMARTLFKSWFVDFDPVRAKMEGRWRSGESLPGLPAYLYNFFPNEFVDTGLGKIPTGWSIKTLGELCCKPQYGYTASAKLTPPGPKFLRITDINKKPWIDWSLVPYCTMSRTDSTKYCLHRGDILIARMADPGHGVMIEDQDLDAVFASYLIRFQPIRKSDSRLLQYWLRSNNYWTLVKSSSVGTTRMSLNAKTISEFQLVTPPDPTSVLFSNLIDVIRQNVIANIQESNTLLTIRDTILPKIISGDLRV